MSEENKENNVAKFIYHQNLEMLKRMNLSMDLIQLNKSLEELSKIEIGNIDNAKERKIAEEAMKSLNAIGGIKTLRL